MQAGFLSAFGLLIIVVVVAATHLTLAAPAQDSPSAPTGVLEAEDLGVSLARIQQRLARLPEGEEARRRLRLDYYVRVYGRAPRLERFRGFDLHNGPVPYGAPMHDDMLRVMRGTQLYPPPVNLINIMGWTWKALQ